MPPSAPSFETVVWSRDGRLVAVAEPERVSIQRLRGSHDVVRVDAGVVHGVVAFDDHVWIAERVASGGFQLRRIDDHGRMIGVPMRLDSGASDGGELVLGSVPLGAPAARWGQIAILDDLGTLRPEAVPAADLAIAMTARRWITVRGQRLELGNGVGAPLPVRRATGGAVLCDGAIVVLIGATPDTDRELVVLARTTGAVQLRCKLPAGALGFAARRGLALIEVDPRAAEVLDLRSGRPLGVIASDRDTAGIALAPDGRTVAIAYRGDAIELLALDAALGRRLVLALGPPPQGPPAGEAEDHVVVEPFDPGTPPPADAFDDVEGSREGLAFTGVRQGSHPSLVPAPILDGDVAPGDAAPAPPPELIGPFDLAALCPRPRIGGVDPALAAAQLAAELDTAGLRTLLAITEAWDTRRIGYADESANPHEHEVAALLGLNTGFALAHVDQARARLVAHEAALAADAHYRSARTPLGELARELGLDDLALDVLILVAAPALRGEVARLYGILANDRSRPLVDELLASTILASHASRDAVRRALDPRAPLVRTGAVRVAGDRARPFAALAVDPVVLARLLAETPDLGAATVVRTEAPALAELALPRATVAAAIDALSHAAAAPARLAVRGRHGFGLRTLCASLAREAHRALAVIDASRLPGAGLDEQCAALAAALARAHLASHLPCLVHLDRLALEDRRGRDALGDVLRRHPGPIAACLPIDAPAPFDAGHVVVTVAAPTETQRVAAWTAALADAGLTVDDVDALAARYRLGVASIRRAADAVAARRATVRSRTRRADRAADADAGPDLERYLRQDRELRIGEHARRVERLAPWSSLVLPPDVLDSLRELIGRVRHRRQVFDTWGMSRAVSTSRGLTALFAGLPGTGKTMVAGVIARELGLDLYQVDLSKVVSRWLGETERNLGAIFDAAEEGQCVLLFDEADSLFAKRTEVKSSNDRYANLEVNYLLQRLDAFEGIAILTTNFGGSIDPAFKRRMSFKLSFPFPDEDTREQLWRVHLPPELPVAGALDLAALSRRFQLSGGYIRNACLRAAFLAAQEETSVTHAHLERAVTLEFAEIGKLSSSGSPD